MTIQKYDLIVVGSGFSGGIIAYLAANRRKKRVLVLEQREHISGNMYDECDPETGILVQRYGPHSFHTDKKEVYDLVREIGEWEPYTLRGRVEIKGRVTPSPFNFQTVDTFFEPEKAMRIKKHLAEAYDYAPKATILELLNSTDETIREYAGFLFENDYRPYSAKQWGIPPEELDPLVLKRVPVRLTYADAYFDDRYQMMPQDGFTAFFCKMLDNPLIEIRTGVDARKHISAGEDGTLSFDGEPVSVPVIYTGALDEFFGCRFGKLPYRSLSFEYETLDMASYQENSSVAYPMAVGFTRITEFTKLPYQDGRGKTIIAREYPEVYGTERGRIPYYPILTTESEEIFDYYRKEAKKYKLFFPCGRLADFKYYNMDNAIERATGVYNELIKIGLI